MTYSYFGFGKTGSVVGSVLKKTGQKITLKNDIGPNVEGSTILFADVNDTRNSTHGRFLHTPRPGSTTAIYRMDAGHLESFDDYYEIYGNFDQNSAFQDGSIKVARGNALDPSPTHARVGLFGNQRDRIDWAELHETCTVRSVARSFIY